MNKSRTVAGWPLEFQRTHHRPWVHRRRKFAFGEMDGPVPMVAAPDRGWILPLTAAVRGAWRMEGREILSGLQAVPSESRFLPVRSVRRFLRCQ